MICGANPLLSVDQGLIMKDWPEHKISEELSGYGQHKMADKMRSIDRHYRGFLMLLNSIHRCPECIEIVCNRP